MPATATVFAPGDVFGGYRILEVIGTGGMAVVYRAEQESLGREVALKVLAPAFADDRAFRDRFRREGRHIAALDHPNIITVYDSGEVDGCLFLTMRLVEGETLADRIGAGGVTADHSVALLTPIADALDVAGAAGLVHRDIKPQNILIDHRGRSYLADFGIAKGATTTGAGATAGFVGTYNYAAPEQLLGGQVTPATDVYGLTAVLFQCLTGQPPFGDTDLTALHARVNGPPPAVDPGQPGAVRCNQLLERGMARRPADRFENAGAMMGDAAALVGELDESRRRISPAFTVAPTQRGGETQPAGAIVGAGSTPVVERPRRTPWLLGAGVAALAVIVGAVIALTSGGSPGAHKPTVSAVRATPFTIHYATPWRRVAATGTNQIELADGDATLTGVASSAAVPGGVPPALARGYGRPLESSNTTVAGHPGRRYAWAPVGESVIAYVLALANGDSAIVCRGPAGAAEALRSCAALAKNAGVSGATVLAPGPDRRLAGAIRRPLASVAAARSALNGLGESTLAARAAPASKLADTERHAAAALNGLSTPERYGRAVKRLASAIAREDGALVSLARAARANDRTTYSLGRMMVQAASRNLSLASGALEPYELGVPHLGVLRLDPPPEPPVVTNPTSTSSGSGSSTYQQNNPPPVYSSTVTGSAK